MSIANKEARESLYWLRLLKESGYLAEYDNKGTLFSHLNSILSLLTKILKTSKATKELMEK